MPLTTAYSATGASYSWWWRRTFCSQHSECACASYTVSFRRLTPPPSQPGISARKAQTIEELEGVQGLWSMVVERTDDRLRREGEDTVLVACKASQTTVSLPLAFRILANPPYDRSTPSPKTSRCRNFYSSRRIPSTQLLYSAGHASSMSPRTGCH